MKIGRSMILKYSNTSRWYNPYILQTDWLVKLQILHGLKDVFNYESGINNTLYASFKSLY